MTVYL